MEPINEKTVNLLNDLIEINNDRIEGYEKAGKETEDQDLKSLFLSLADDSRTYRSDLISEVIAMGGKPAEGTTTSGKVYRAWMDIKAALTAKDRQAIIGSCEFGEDAALEAYDDVLKEHEKLTAKARDLVTRQREKLQRSHDQVKMLRDAAEAR